ncbi:MAG: SRPBCC domain-containing protein [Candidatus Solibacter sp.]
MQTRQDKRNQSSTAEGSAPTPKLLEIRRDFQVPVALLYEAFTSAEALKSWWWPDGLHAGRIDFDFREGGQYFISMKGRVQGKDASGGMTGEFEEIVENQRIVMTDSFADEKGRVISAHEAGMPGQWPEQISITFEFEAAGKAASRFRLVQQGIPDEMQKDCVQGWSESFDKLERYLAVNG